MGLLSLLCGAAAAKGRGGREPRARTCRSHAATLDKDMHTYIHTRMRSAWARACADASPRA